MKTYNAEQFEDMVKSKKACWIWGEPYFLSTKRVSSDGVCVLVFAKAETLEEKNNV